MARKNVVSAMVLLVVFGLLMEFLPSSNAAGGIAEMKALTGDTPYVGTGNHEQAPEFFGEAFNRQMYNPAAYDYYGSRFQRNQAATFYGGYSNPWRNYGGGSPPPGALPPHQGPGPIDAPPMPPPGPPGSAMDVHVPNSAAQNEPPHPADLGPIPSLQNALSGAISGIKDLATGGIYKGSGNPWKQS